LNIPVPQTDRDRITVAIAAMGGQGGGVLADWILEMGERSGYYVQVTSVPGVAQRTGATIYYLELFPEGTGTQAPVLALMPVPGDIDVVVAAELAEAGRAVQRGIVTPDRTTLIASDHRSYAIAEKSAMGDGRTSSVDIRQAIHDAAKAVVCFDMQTLAETHNTVISATLFGALAGSSVLPFTTEQFEAAITGTGKSVANNLAAFAAAFELASAPSLNAVEPARAKEVVTPARASDPEVVALLGRIDSDLCAAVQPTALIGVRRLLDYQDPAYASLYLDRLVSIQKLDPQSSGQAGLTELVARHLALWMSYEDTIRVADLKIRRERFDRCRTEIRAKEGELVYLTEYMHPRVEEVADTLPRSIGSWLLSTPWAQKLLSRFVLRERKIHTSKLSGYLLLYGVSSLQRFRRSTYRYVTEQQRIISWLNRIESTTPKYYDLALEVARCQNLIKGYGDTHARGVKNFNRIMETMDGRPASSETTSLVAELRTAALADEDGAQLEERLAKVA
jgi:indolepyruvate ferredoxin oxidoreductase beta subunit